MAEEDSFDLDAAGLRADGADVTAYVEVLARKLEDALPTETTVRRRSKGFMSREKVVDTIEVTLGESRFGLQLKGRRVESHRAKEVRGVVIKRETLELNAWVIELATELREQARGSSQALQAFQRLVG
jgi:hypothetical protein